MNPLISVIIPTYNHEKYIAETIQSVLDQTFKDFELIVINDGSTDRTEEIIQKFKDDRIRYIYQQNQGPSRASNRGILEAKGTYICLLAGDDVYYPEKLEIQYKYLTSYNKKVLFTWIDTIDDDGNILDGHHIQKYFNVPNRSRTELFNSFFLKGNDLCGVTVMVEKSTLIEAGLMHLTSIQMQDFYMWIKLVKSYDLSVIEKKLVKYRIRNQSGNLSLSPENSIRTAFEGYQLYREIFDDVSEDFFRLSFSDKLKYQNFQGADEYELEKAFLYLNHHFPLLQNSNIFQTLGAEKLFDILQSERILSIAISKYELDLPELYKLTKHTDTTNIQKQFDLQYQLKQSQSQLHQTQLELNQTQLELNQTQLELNQTQFELAAIRNSKFWKLRSIWLRIKHFFRLNSNNNFLEESPKDKNIQEAPKAYKVNILNKVEAERIRIVHVIPNFMTGGSSQLVVDLIEHLGHLYEQEIITSYIPCPPSYIGVNIYEYDNSASSNDIFNRLQKFRPQIVHIHYWGDCDTPWYHKVLSCVEKYGCIVVENINTPVKPYLREYIDRYVYVSNYVKKEFGYEKANHLTIYPGSNLEKFSRDDKDDIPDNCIGMVYRLEKDKLNEQSIDVFIQVAKKRPQTKVIIVGGGTFLELYKRKVNQANVENNFTFTGYVPYEELPNLYKKMSIFVAPVWKESFGQVSSFAMNMRIPVVGYNVGALSEIINNENLLAPPSDSVKLGNIIIDLLNDRDRRLQVGNFNQQRFQKLFSLEAMINKYYILYKELLEGK
ncbi:glycosyltransferase [Pseudanabaena sp. FACHB-1998]|uniref:glycosyltransferase n=1 Tax=Pseudanabaena sp. FACHB-1998 TaxID=2692858 RepID=UPI0016803301|nr:glycosyltransferase [Pseudanabaena sp. FACHB-1998]MBD2177249.1 glycosyltransferase [Pseudanabaena sp. FACHB-1998]